MRSDQTILTQTLGFAGEYFPAVEMDRPHRHQELELTYLPNVPMVYRVGSDLITLPVNRFIAFWAAVPHQSVQVDVGVPFYWFTIPFAWALQWNLPQEFIDAMLRGKLLVDSAPLSIDHELCRMWIDNIKARTPQHAVIAQLEIEARLRRLALSAHEIDTYSKPTLADRSAARRVQRMLEYIAEHYTEELTVADIGREVGLHPNYAMALFHRHTSHSIGNFILEHRLFHAKRLLATTNAKIIDIALESGFGSASRFYDIFRRAVEMSPKEFREAQKVASVRGSKPE